MKTIDAIKKRRSIRYYDSNYVIPDNEINELINLTMLTATSYNIQHWKFVVVDNPRLRKEIRKVSFDQAQITDASKLILVCTDIKAWEKDMPRKWENAPSEISDFMVSRSKMFYQDKEQLQRDEAIRSASFATQTLVLASVSKGYDTGVMIGFESEKVAKLINLPKDYIISNFVVIGKGIEAPFIRGGQLPLEEVRIKNSF
jgi:nitroreductase